MSHETARALDVLLALAFLVVAGAIVWRAVTEVEPLVMTAMRLLKRAS
jgi:hypothetical protein